MKIVDGQIHLWLPDTPEHPWVPGSHAHGESFTMEEALATFDRAGVRGGVIVSPSWLGSDNFYGLLAAQAHPDCFAVMGRFDFAAPDPAARLEAWRSTPGMLGIRATLVDDLTMSMFRDPANHWFWEKCAELGIPVMAYVPNVIPLIGPVARAAPDLRIIVDHAGRFARGPKDAAAWEDLDQLLALAALPNVAVKVSSLPSFSSEPYPFANLHPRIRAIYDAFGPDRMIWGSDVTRLTCNYEDNIRLFSEALDFLSEDDKEKIFARNLTRWCDADLG